MFDIVEFLELIGWGDWFAQWTAEGNEITFSDLCFGTLPYILQLAFVIFMLNWVMGMISDGVKLRLGGGRL